MLLLAFFLVCYLSIAYHYMTIEFYEDQFYISSADGFNPMQTIKSFKGGEMDSYNAYVEFFAPGEYHLEFIIKNKLFTKKYIRILHVK